MEIAITIGAVLFSLALIALGMGFYHAGEKE